MSKHTPGPWTVAIADTDIFNLDHDSMFCIEQAEEPHKAIALAWTDFDEDDPQPIDDSDANLIAAAPEMLHCLRVIVDHAEGLNLDAALHLKETRAIIAKAEGRE